MSAPFTKSAVYTYRIRNLISNFGMYSAKLNKFLQSGISLSNIIRMQFPGLLRSTAFPNLISIEITNICNVKCVYCSNQTGLRQKGMMNEQTFRALFESMKELPPAHIRMVGNGEATIHPNFGEFITKLSSCLGPLTLVTNGQWKNASTVDAIVEAPVNIIEISIDGGGKEAYESSRQGASYEKLFKNLAILAEKRSKKNTLVIVRLMLRPSQYKYAKTLSAPWRKYADAVVPQRIWKLPGTPYHEDVFKRLTSTKNAYPKCTLPFLDFNVNWSGNVPLCSGSARQSKSEGIMLGNIRESSICDIWNAPLIQQYRKGIQYGKKELIPLCQGCSSC